jgi:hypothetical protein
VRAHDHPERNRQLAIDQVEAQLRKVKR